MKRSILTAIVAVSIAVPLAVPTIASANTASTTSYVSRGFSTQIHNRARLSGITITASAVRCASDGGGYYSCWATYTAYMSGVHARFGVYINVTPTRWYTVGTPRELSVW